MLGAYDFSKISVLIVDDSKFMRSLVMGILHGFGVRDFHLAADGAEALHHQSLTPADLIITDYVMSPIDGVELTRTIRNELANTNPFVPIILMTAYTEKSRVIAARDAGITEFLAKPVTVNSVLERVITCIERPRRFVRAKDYFGPDRRRTGETKYPGEERRKAVLLPG